MSFDSRILDITDPSASGSALPGVIQGGAADGSVNATRLQNLLNEALTDSPTTAKAIYVPIGRFRLGATVTLPNVNSFRIFGGGGMCKGLSQMQAKTGACTYFEWTGGAAGPMFRLQNTDGDVWENINFDGVLGPETNAGGAGLDVLITRLRSNVGSTSGALFHHWKNCSFFRAQRLFWGAKGTGSGVGTAEETFSKCMFNNGETSSHRWTSQAYYSDNPQAVNITFDSNCEFNNCGYAVYVVNTGRITLDGPTIAIVGTLLLRDGGSQNVAGDRILFPHIDGGNGSEGRKALYKSINPDSTHGHVVIQTPKFGVVTTADEFSAITSFSGTSLVLTSPIRMRAGSLGDRVQFHPKSVIDAGDFSGTGMVETTIATRTDDNTYTTAATASSLGITTLADWYCCNGEALITCVSSDYVTLHQATLSGRHLAGGRLARLTHSSFTTGRSPKVILYDPQSQGWGVDFTEAGFASLFTLTGTAYWLMKRVDPLADGNPPTTFGNFDAPGGGSGDTTNVFQQEQRIMRKYATSHVVKFVLQDPTTGNFKTGVTFEAGDVKIVNDEAAPANTTNLPVEIGGGDYKITLTTSEKSGKDIDLLIQDQTPTPTFRPVRVSIDTYGHANAQHELDLDVAEVAADVKKFDTEVEGVLRIKRATRTMFLGTVGSGSTVNTVVTSSLDPSPTVTDQLKNSVLMFAGNTTTAALRGKRVDISGSTIGGQITVAIPLPTAPVSGDTFVAG